MAGWRGAVSMRNSIAYGRRYAARSIVLQLGATVLLATAWAVARGVPAALAAGFGGGAVVLGNALMALRLFAARPVPARQVLRAVYAGEVLKLGLMVAMLYAAIALLDLPFMPLLAGLVLAQAMSWIALVAVR